jgi:hypothetical protein
MFFIIPDDIVILITYFLDIKTFCNFRRVYRIKWSTTKVKQHSKTVLEKIELKSLELIDYGSTLNFQKRRRTLCTHCNYKAISFIEWTSGHRRPYIPWCPIHVYGPIMDCVECYSL